MGVNVNKNVKQCVNNCILYLIPVESCLKFIDRDIGFYMPNIVSKRNIVYIGGQEYICVINATKTEKRYTESENHNSKNRFEILHEFCKRLPMPPFATNHVEKREIEHAESIIGKYGSWYEVNLIS